MSFEGARENGEASHALVPGNPEPEAHVTQKAHGEMTELIVN